MGRTGGTIGVVTGGDDSMFGAAKVRAGGTIGVAMGGDDSTIGAERDAFGSAFVTAGEARGVSTTGGACGGAAAGTGGAGIALEAAEVIATFSGT